MLEDVLGEVADQRRFEIVQVFFWIRLLFFWDQGSSHFGEYGREFVILRCWTYASRN